MIQAGLYQPGADPALDEAVTIWPLLDQFTGLNMRGKTDLESFALLEQIISGQGAEQTSSDQV